MFTSKEKIYFCLLFFTALAWSSLMGQKSGDQVFDNSRLHEVRLQFDQPNFWQVLTHNYESNFNQPVPYLMGHVTIDGEQVDSVGVRFKGFTSYSFESDKKPIKLDFNEFVKGKRFDGLRKLNLNNSTGDASMQRDILCYELMRQMGVSAPRTAFARVYINDTYWGLYQLIEQVDKEFLQNNFSNEEGHLFKNKEWNDFEWMGFEPSAYNPPYELKTNREGTGQWTGLINLMDVINNSNTTGFAEEIEKIFNVDLYLKTLAVDVATNNWDSNLEHGRNWYMYEDTVTGVFHWIPWDYNFALGGTLFGGGDECTFFPSFLSNTDGTPKVEFFNTSFYSSNVTWQWDFGDGASSTEKAPTHTYAQGGTYNVCMTIDFNKECSEVYCWDVNTEIDVRACEAIANNEVSEVNQAFLQVIDWNPECCGEWTETCAQSYGDLNGGSGSGFSIDQKESNRKLIQKLFEVPDFVDRYEQHFCDLMNYEMKTEKLFAIMNHNYELIDTSVEQDPNHLFSYDAFVRDIGANAADEGLKNYLSNRIEKLNEEVSETINCATSNVVSFQEVVVNEFMASNDSIGGIADPAGGYADWIELFNNTDQAIDLTDVYLSDNKNNLKKWQFPAGTNIAPRGYLIVWADDDEEQEGIHANFKLSKSGEELVLSNQDDTIIDSLTFGEQTTNIASARIPNGSGPFVFQAATFASNNDFSSSINKVEKLVAGIFPNPATNTLNINIESGLAGPYHVQIHAITGKHLLSFENHNVLQALDLSMLNPGMYALQLTNKNGQSSTLKFVKAE